MITMLIGFSPLKKKKKTNLCHVVGSIEKLKFCMWKQNPNGPNICFRPQKAKQKELNASYVSWAYMIAYIEPDKAWTFLPVANNTYHQFSVKHDIFIRMLLRMEYE